MELNFSGFEVNFASKKPRDGSKTGVFRHQIWLQANRYVREQLLNT